MKMNGEGVSKVIITDSEKETEEAGRLLGEKLFPGAVLLLSGQLGAGKTVFARGIARGLGITGAVQSPTFTLLCVYQGRLPFYHFDLYRLEDEEELYELGLDEYLLDDGVFLAEWADKFPAEFNLPALRINIEATGECSRKLTFSGDKAYESILDGLKRNTGGR